MPINPKSNGKKGVRRHACLQQHFTVRELADLWNLPYKKLRKLFQRVPGVVRLGDSLSIPIAIADREYQRLTEVPHQSEGAAELGIYVDPAIPLVQLQPSRIRQRLRKVQGQSEIVLDNESKERALVGDIISTVALAGQISREFSVSDHGIDMEIEFKNDAGKATGQKLYLQLKSGDSYLYQRKSDGAEVFEIKNERHASYWMAQAFPVMLVIRSSDGAVRWMEVREWLKRASENGKRPVKQIVFQGEGFDVKSVHRWRDELLRQGSS